MPKKQITIPVFIPHSGCPHQCIFCNQWRVTGVSQNVSPESIRDTINKYLSSIPDSVKRVELAFFGGSFTAIPVMEQTGFLSRALPYIENGTIDSIRISTRPDYIDKTRLKILKEFCVETVELGVQSFSDEVLKASGRGHDSASVVDAVSLLRDSGFRVGIQLMPGLPGDTFETSILSTLKTIELMPDDVRIYPAVVLKDTGLEKMYNEKKFIPLTTEETVELCSVMYGLVHEKGINIIRMGLHPMENGSGHIIAGPYHEALGFMIKSRYRRRILETIVASGIKLVSGIKDLSLVIPEKMKEEYIGMKKENIIYIKNKYNFNSINYKFDDIANPLVLR